MRALSGSLSKLVAVAATLAVSIAVPALLVQVGALDAVGRELAMPAPSGAQVVVATTQAQPVAVPHRVVGQVPAAARQQEAVARSRTPVKVQPRATQISSPASVHTATPAPAQPSPLPPTTTMPSTTTPSPPTTTPTTPTVPSTPGNTTTTTTTTPPFTTTTTTTTPAPITFPPPRVGVVTVPPQFGTDVYHDGTSVAVAV